MEDRNYSEYLLNRYKSCDDEVFSAIEHEMLRQYNQIELIASENFVSPAVLAAMGSILTNKYAEGYSGKRYYGGCINVDAVEDLAIERACRLFNCKYANVQPHSGAQANMAAFYAFLKPGDTILGMDLACGGHLTHGAKPTVSGKWFNSITYGVKREDGFIDYQQVEELAQKHQPKLIIAGASSYPRKIDFEKFAAIATSAGAILMADVAHYAGLIACGEYPNPVPYADVITTTTHKTLRGPRGGMILWNNNEYSKKINSAVFPGIQGGPLMHVIAAKAVAFKEALNPTFKVYIKKVKENASTLAAKLAECGLKIATGGTDSHMLTADVYTKFGINGKQAEEALERAGITCNKNAIPFDTLPVTEASGIRLGSPAATTRGFDSKNFEQIAMLISEVLAGLSINGAENNKIVEEKVREIVRNMCLLLSN